MLHMSELNLILLINSLHAGLWTNFDGAGPYHSLRIGAVGTGVQDTNCS